MIKSAVHNKRLEAFKRQNAQLKNFLHNQKEDDTKEELFKVTTFLCKMYKISSCPSIIVKKSKDILGGVYESGGSRKLFEPICADLLIEMIQYYKVDLRKANAYLEKKGKPLSPSQKILYDFAIIIDKYEEYKRLKKRAEQQMKEFEEGKINDQVIAQVVNLQHVPVSRKQNDAEDLEKLFEEIEQDV